MLPPFWATLTSYLEDLLEPIQRKALRIIFGETEYADAMAMASFDTLKARRVVACQRFTLIVQQHPNIITFGGQKVSQSSGIKDYITKKFRVDI